MGEKNANLFFTPIDEEQLPEIKFKVSSFLLINRVKIISICLLQGYHRVNFVLQ